MQTFTRVVHYTCSCSAFLPHNFLSDECLTECRRISFRQICTRKEFRRYEGRRIRQSLRSSQSTGHPRSYTREHFPESNGRQEGTRWRHVVCLYVLHPVARGKRDRTHPRACARKGTRPRPEYFIFTYQR